MQVNIRNTSLSTDRMVDLAINETLAITGSRRSIENVVPVTNMHSTKANPAPVLPPVTGELWNLRTPLQRTQEYNSTYLTGNREQRLQRGEEIDNLRKRRRVESADESVVFRSCALYCHCHTALFTVTRSTPTLSRY